MLGRCDGREEVFGEQVGRAIASKRELAVKGRYVEGLAPLRHRTSACVGELPASNRGQRLKYVLLLSLDRYFDFGRGWERRRQICGGDSRTADSECDLMFRGVQYYNRS